MDPILVGAIVTVVTGVILTSFKYWLDRRADARRAADEAAKQEAEISRVQLYDARGRSPEQIRKDVAESLELERSLRGAPSYAPPGQWPALVIVIVVIAVVVAIIRLVS